MVLSKGPVKVLMGFAALAFFVAVSSSSQAGRRYHGSLGSSGGSSGGYGSSGGSSGGYGSSGGSSGGYGSSGGSYGSSGGSSGSYGSRGGIFRRRALRRGSHGSSGGYYYSSGGSAYGSSGGSSGGYHHSSHGSSGGSSGGVVIYQPASSVYSRPPAVNYPAPAVKHPAPAPKAPAPQPKVAPAPKKVPPAPKKKDDQARMTIQVPADAVVSLNGHQMKLTGKTRKFISPALPTNNAYVYTVKVEVVRDGKLISNEQQQIVRAGKNYELTFIEQNGSLVFVDPSAGNVVVFQ